MTEMDLSRVPPNSIEAEKALLSCILGDNACLDDITDQISPEAFYDSRHGAIYVAMRELMRDQIAVDVITLTNRLKQSAFFEKSGRDILLIDYCDIVPSPANYPHYVRIIQEKYRARELLKTFIRATAELFDGVESHEVLDQVEKVISADLPSCDEVPFSELLFQILDNIDGARDSRNGLLSTGLSALDDLTGGLHATDLIVVAGHTSHGKTAFMIQLIRELVRQQIPTGIIELEMPAIQIANRIVSQISGLSLYKFRQNHFTEADIKKIEKAGGELDHAEIMVEDSPGLSVEQIRSIARRWKRKKNLGALFIDYLQLIKMPTAERRDLQVGEVTMALKGLAKELEIPIVLLSQLNRDSVKEKREPRLQDLRDSGSIEQDSDMVLFVWRPDIIEEPEKAKIIVAKHRNGPTGKLDVRFEKLIARFSENVG